MRIRILGTFLVFLTAVVTLVSCGGQHNGEPRFDPQYTVYADLLKRHVDDNGGVDYAGLKKDSVLVLKASQDLRAIARDTLEHFRPREQMAYWINAYNLLLLETVTQFYPVDSIQDILNVLDRAHHSVAERTVSLNEIDRKILQRGFSDPRVCFALCRAAAGSPSLLNQPYRADGLQAQLQAATSRFLADSSHNTFDPDKRTAMISRIFDWYKKEILNVYRAQIPSDQPEDIRAVFNLISESVPDSVGRFLHDEGVTWSYRPFDWRLNDQGKRTGAIPQ